MKTSRLLIIIFAVAIAVTFIPLTPVDSATKVKISHKSYKLDVGKTVKLKVTGAKKVKWSSSNKKVATVTSKGVVKGKAEGSATIKAKAGKKLLKCKITVKKAFDAEKVKSQIIIDTSTASKGCLKITNPSEFDVCGLLTYSLLDSSGITIDTANRRFNIQSGKETYVRTIPGDEHIIAEVKAIVNSLYQGCDQRSFSVVKEKEEREDIYLHLTYLFTNTSETGYLDESPLAVFKKDGEILYATQSPEKFIVQAGETIRKALVVNASLVSGYDEIEFVFQ